jgi:hypothetical protein
LRQAGADPFATAAPMQLDPTTVCLRSFAGDDEARKATHGLSLVQRRILVLLDRPRTLVTFAALHRLEPRRFERDLLRLAELGLVKLLSPAQAIALANDEPVARAAD